MIVPQNRLLFWFAVVVLPMTLVVAAEPAWALAALAVIGLLTVVALVDAVGGRRQLAGIGVKLPEVVRLSKDREARLELRIQNRSQQRRPLRVALGLPAEVTSAQEDLRVELPDGSEWSRLWWPCTPLKRGSYPVANAYVECPSALGFWALRRALPVNAELRVYPNLLTDRKSLAALFLNRGAFGLHAQRQVGKGREFERLREYVHGDGYEDLHWKASARRGRPITKVFQLERTQEVYVAIDISRLSARCGGSAGDPGGGERLIERFITAGLTLGIVAERQGDQFGLATFSDRPQAFLRAARGPGHFHACRDLLYTAEPRLVNPDFAELFTFLRLRLRRRALVVVVTDLSDPVIAETFIQHVALLRERHVVLAAHVTAPGVKPIFTGGPVQQLEDVYAALAGHLQWHDLHERVRTLALRGVPLRLVEEAALAPALVDNYMTVKRRQLL